MLVCFDELRSCEVVDGSIVMRNLWVLRKWCALPQADVCRAHALTGQGPTWQLQV